MRNVDYAFYYHYFYIRRYPIIEWRVSISYIVENEEMKSTPVKNPGEIAMFKGCNSQMVFNQILKKKYLAII